MAEDTHAGFAALIGAPNAGKSTLMNAMVGSKVSIVTPKVQTTRSRIRGIAMEGNAQIIFITARAARSIRTRQLSSSNLLSPGAVPRWF